MSSATPAAPDPSMQGHLPPHILEAFDEAHQLQRDGKIEAAIARLEDALTKLSPDSDLAQFKERVSLAMAIAEFSVGAGNAEKAISNLASQFNVAKETFQKIKATGTDEDKRMAFRGLVQLRDLHTRLKLIGQPAPELAVKEWLNSSPLTLADLKGKVVLLEFWATWCKPCQEMFPKLTSLYEQESKNGLEILAITRHYMAYGGTLEAKNEELDLIRKTVGDHGVTFRVAVADDEKLQATFGANGLPTVVLIDRMGIVQYAGPGGEDPAFEKSLRNCLAAGN
jgi:thiol-disulfide isomerase/thioredoxin